MNNFSMNNLGVEEALVVLGFLLCIYFLPSIIGARKRNFWAIFALNLFLGWTFIGWIVALVWSLSRDATVKVINHLPEVKATSLASDLENLQSLRERGVLSEDEFTRAKEKLLT